MEALQVTDPSIQSLRDATLDFFTRVQETVPPVPRQRARHVITENERVIEFAEAARAGDLEAMGKLFRGVPPQHAVRLRDQLRGNRFPRRLCCEAFPACMEHA